jgi:hypothetical protein
MPGSRLTRILPPTAFHAVLSTSDGLLQRRARRRPLGTCGFSLFVPLVVRVSDAVRCSSQGNSPCFTACIPCVPTRSGGTAPRKRLWMGVVADRRIVTARPFPTTDVPILDATAGDERKGVNVVRETAAAHCAGPPPLDRAPSDWSPCEIARANAFKHAPLATAADCHQEAIRALPTDGAFTRPQLSGPLTTPHAGRVGQPLSGARRSEAPNVTRPRQARQNHTFWLCFVLSPHFR